MRILLLALFLATLTGCANIWRMENGPLTAFSEAGREAPEPLYNRIWVRLDKQTDARVLAARVKLAESAPLVAIGALRPAFVAQYLPPFVPPPQWPESWKEKARQDDNYEGGGIFVSFRQGRLVMLSLTADPAQQAHAPQVAGPGSTTLLSLPLSRVQMEAVFGAPRRVYRVSEIRY